MVQTGSLSQCGGSILACIALSSCTVGAIGPETYELANIRPSNAVPKSSPAAFVRAFRQFCVAGLDSPSRFSTRLRAADYIEVPGRPDDNIASFVVDDLRPAVMVSTEPGAPFCAVIAESRAGQTTRVLSFIAEDFPNAVPIDPSAIGSDTENAWIVGGEPQLVIFTVRRGQPRSPATLMLAIGLDGRS